MSHSKSGIVFLVHGTRNVQALEVIIPALEALCRRFAETVQLPPDAVRFSFLEMASPPFEATLRDLCAHGKTEIRVLPLLLFPGTHLYTDIPATTRQVMQDYPGVRIQVSGHIGVEEPEFLQILLKRL